MSDLFSAFEDHAVARRTDPQTSHDAAASVQNIRRSQQQVLDVLRDGPQTDEQIYRELQRRWIGISLSGARTRRSELVAKGLVVDSGHRELTRARRQTIVWRLA